MENKAKSVLERENKKHEFSSTVTYSPSFSYYASEEFAAAAVKVSRENQSYNNKSVRVESDAEFEFETSPLHEETFVHFATFKKDVVSVNNKKEEDDAAENISESLTGNCLWSPLRSSSSTTKRCRLKKLLTRSNSDGVVLAPSASKGSYFKEFMKRSHSDGGEGSKKRSSAVKKLLGKEKTVGRKKLGEGEKRRKSYLPYRQDLIGIFVGIRGLRPS